MKFLNGLMVLTMAVVIVSCGFDTNRTGGANENARHALALRGSSSLDGVMITASSSDENIPQNILDGNMTSRWSAQGHGEWIKFKFKCAMKIDDIQLAFHLGNQRVQRFQIQYSTDDQSYRIAYAGQSSSKTQGFQRFELPDATIQYVRIVGFGNSQNDWNSLLEAGFGFLNSGRCVGAPSAETTPAPATPIPTNIPTPSVVPTPAPQDPKPTPVVATPAPTVTPSVVVPSGDLNPNKAPGANFDLSLWKLTLPVDSNGGFSGRAMEIKPIPSDFEQEKYFYTAFDGGMVFNTPTDGAKTSTNTSYPRTELRELDADGKEIAWKAGEGGLLRASLKVTVLPRAVGGVFGRIVIGQIHGPNDELCRLYYDNGNLYFYDDKAGSSPKETQFQLLSADGKRPNIPLNEKFSYEIRVDPMTKIQTVSVIDKSGVVYSAQDRLSSFWWPADATKMPGLYFKAGNYLQVSPSGGTKSDGSKDNQGEVVFYQLSKPLHGNDIK